MDTRGIAGITRHSEVSEKEIEKYLVRRCKEAGIPCLKYSNPGMVGYPDRLVVLPSATVVWVELKSLGRRPSKIQRCRIAELERMGHRVFVADSRSGIDELIKILGL